MQRTFLSKSTHLNILYQIHLSGINNENSLTKEKRFVAPANTLMILFSRRLIELIYDPVEHGLT